MTCDELARCWATRWPRPDPATNQNHDYQVRRFGREFRGRLLDSIGRSEAMRWASQNSGQARYVRAMFADALDEGLVKFNVWSKMRIPRQPRARVEIPSDDEVMALAAARPGVMGSMILFAAGSGLRLGEQRAFSRFDVGEPFNRARVEFQLTRDDVLKKPKTAASVRTFLITARAQVVLTTVLREQTDAETKARPWRLWPISRKRHLELWNEAREATGLTYKWHSLRHFYATQLLDAGATVDDVAATMGCRAEEVRATYAHPDHDLALERMERLLGDGS